MRGGFVTMRGGFVTNLDDISLLFTDFTTCACGKVYLK